eukprot:768194-Hanusia_phi.AAC.6
MLSQKISHVAPSSWSRKFVMVAPLSRVTCCRPGEQQPQLTGRGYRIPPQPLGDIPSHPSIVHLAWLHLQDLHFHNVSKGGGNIR